MTAPRVKLSEAQWRDLHKLSEHAGCFAYGYGQSAHVLWRLGLAKRKLIPAGKFNWKFAITRAGRAALARAGDGGDHDR